MTYVTVEVIRALSGTKIITADLQAMIDDAEAEVDARLAAAGVAGIPGDPTLRAAATCLTQVRIFNRGRLDGSHPDSRTMGTASGSITLSMNIGTAISQEQAKAEALISSYIAVRLNAARAADAQYERADRVDANIPAFRLDRSRSPWR